MATKDGPGPAEAAASTVARPLPTVQQVRAWLKLAESSMDDAELEIVLDAETCAQARCCRTPTDGTIPPDLYAALLRRCAREVAARGVPLGLTGPSDEYGPTRLPAYDAEIERLEGPLRIAVMG